MLLVSSLLSGSEYFDIAHPLSTTSSVHAPSVQSNSQNDLCDTMAIITPHETDFKKTCSCIFPKLLSRMRTENCVPRETMAEDVQYIGRALSRMYEGIAQWVVSVQRQCQEPRYCLVSLVLTDSQGVFEDRL